ncbi:hypothetical protein RHGRI_019909 [Rhododendron griersonianum]|uniref:RING-type domain-containing protein n=1 Tax=Rhododendron griersonianum TaxID=479676 RepID=A0AAV6JEG5_9ERIC|nr:hypothetical protein RHGRI_019896 [Rhododendron griersonianum]KAG5539517.1 hypothetical protein RHGRI_019909 [Rhododendron griersonianum]
MKIQGQGNRCKFFRNYLMSLERQYLLRYCVCLGEFELKEELNQIPTYKHVFHIDCINLAFVQYIACFCTYLPDKPSFR